MFFVGGGGGGEGWSGRLFEGGRLLTFWTFSVGVYSRWALIRRWAVNRINTVNLLLTRLARVRTGRISFLGLFCKDRAYASGRCSPSMALALG